MKEAIRKLQMLFLASLSGMVLMFLVMYFFLMPPSGWELDLGDLFLSLSLVLIMAGWYLSKQIYDKRLLDVQHETIENKFEHYITNVIIRLAFQELPILATLMFFILRENAAQLFLFALGLLLFIQSRPSKKQFQKNYMER